jgi:hypothetical protein
MEVMSGREAYQTTETLDSGMRSHYSGAIEQQSLHLSFSGKQSAGRA